MSETTSDVLEQLSQAKAAAYEYADWFETNSVDRAKKYITAIRRLIELKARRINLAGTGGEQIEIDVQSHLALLEEAKEFVNKRRAMAETHLYGDLSYYRD